MTALLAVLIGLGVTAGLVVVGTEMVAAFRELMDAAEDDPLEALHIGGLS